MAAIFWKEVKSYFYSPIAYILIGFFTLLTSLFFTPNLMQRSGDFNGVLSNMGFFLVFIIPILTMRILAEDRKNGTEVLLVTSPVNLFSIVVGKFLAAYSVFLVITIISLIYPLSMLAFGGQITAPLVGGYIGFLLLGGAFISVGIFASSLTENQVVAVVIGFVCLLIMWVADGLGGVLGGIWAKVLGWFSLISRYGDFNRGILGLSPVIYYLSFTAVFLFLTVRIIERRRWSQG